MGVVVETLLPEALSSRVADKCVVSFALRFLDKDSLAASILQWVALLISLRHRIPNNTAPLFFVVER